MIDKDVINAKFDIIERDLKFCRELGKLNLNEFSYKEQQAAKYTLLEIAEACIDIANHIIASKGFRRAEEYSDLFQILLENNILPESLSSKLSSMAKMRNVLVHRYAEVDSKRLLESVKSDVGDAEQFMRHIAKFMEREVD